MPENQQEIATLFKNRKFLEEGVLVGIGVLLIFLGIFSTVPLTNVVSVGIGVFLFYTAYTIYGDKTDSPKEQREEDPLPSDEYLQYHYHHANTIEEQYFTVPEQEAESRPLQHERRPMESVPKTVPHHTASDFLEESPRITMSTVEPQSEFNHLLLKVLHAIKDVCFGHTVVFFWINHDSKQLVVEAKVTESSSFMSDRKIPAGTDVVSRIGLNGEPEIVNNIQSETERDIVRYYTSLQDVKSFIGVPVFYANDASQTGPIGVIAVDSKAEDAFGDETFSVLSHFSKLISALLVSYTEKYDLMANAKIIEADTALKKRLAQRPTLPMIVNSFVEQLENTVAWDAISVVLFDESQRAWSIASVRVRGSDRFVSPKQLIDLDNSIVGRSVRTNTVININLSTNTQMVFHQHESPSDLLKQGMLLVVPFSSNGKSFGAAAVIHAKSGGMTAKDVAAIEYLSSTIAASLEVIELNSIINELIAVDELTGVLSKKYFTSRLSEELSRANDRTEDLTMVLISLSNVQEIEKRYGIEGKEAALRSVAQHIRVCVRPYDVVGRFERTTFGVILADTIANEAYIWAEKLRTSIAGGIVTFDTKSFSISVTIGISGAAAKMSADDLAKNTTMVLEQAIKAGGNIVRVF